MNSDTVTGFVGGGQMAEAMIRGLIESKRLTSGQIRVMDIRPERRAYLAERYGVTAAKSLRELLPPCAAVVIAVKPADVAAVLREMAPVVGDRPVISIAAGVTLETISAGLNGHTRVIRVMPNTPALIGEGASAYCCGSGARAEDAQMVEYMMGGTGLVIAVPEKLMNAVTALSGSGPAYFFTVIEALVDAGVRVGLPRETATALVLQTAVGSAKMIMKSGEHPAVLRAKVTSPGGTTAAALEVLETAGVRGHLIKAVVAAAEAAAEQGKKAEGR